MTGREEILGASGRSQPRPAPLPDGFTHDVRFRASHGIDGITAECQPCQWRIWIDNGHDLADLAELELQHSARPQAELLRPAVLVGNYDLTTEECGLVLDTLAVAAESAGPERAAEYWALSVRIRGGR